MIGRLVRPRPDTRGRPAAAHGGSPSENELDVTRGDQKDGKRLSLFS